MIAEITSAITIAKESLGLLKSVKDTGKEAELKKDLAELYGKISALQEQLITFRGHYAELIQVKERLEKELIQRDNWEVEKTKYEPVDASEGLLLYALKPDHYATEPKHYLCPHCYQKGSKSLLLRQDANKTTYQCNSCNFKCNPTKWKPPAISGGGFGYGSGFQDVH